MHASDTWLELTMGIAIYKDGDLSLDQIAHLAGPIMDVDSAK